MSIWHDPPFRLCNRTRTFRPNTNDYKVLSRQRRTRVGGMFLANPLEYERIGPGSVGIQLQETILNANTISGIRRRRRPERSPHSWLKKHSSASTSARPTPLSR